MLAVGRQTVAVSCNSLNYPMMGTFSGHMSVRKLFARSPTWMTSSHWNTPPWASSFGSICRIMPSSMSSVLPPAPKGTTRLTHVPDLRFYVFAEARGIFEPVARLGDEVSRQQLAGYLHHADTPWRDPQPAYFRQAGVVICKRALGATRPGDCLYQIAADYEPKPKPI